MSNLIIVEERTLENKKIQIRYDDNPWNPREFEGNLGRMICFYKRANLGDKHSYQNKDEFIYDLMQEAFGEKMAEEKIQKENKESRTEMEADDNLFKSISHKFIIRKLYLYEHSRITMSVNPFHCPWDGGIVGWICVDRDEAKKEYELLSSEIKAKKSINEWINERINGEVDIYDKYIKGEVYAYTLFEDDEVSDGCSGFFDIKDIYEEFPEFST